ncbi:MAG: hypothetical protein R3C41_18105 [Calditrichia bacterium]
MDYIFDSNPTIESDIPVEGYTGDVNFQISEVNKQIGLSVTYRQMFDNYVHLLSYLSIQASITSRSVRDELLFLTRGFHPADLSKPALAPGFLKAWNLKPGNRNFPCVAIR